MTDLQTLITAAQAFGPVAGCMVAFLVGLNRGWWYLGGQFQYLQKLLDIMTKDRDAWRERAEREANDARLRDEKRLERMEWELEQRGRLRRPE